LDPLKFDLSRIEITEKTTSREITVDDAPVLIRRCVAQEYIFEQLLLKPVSGLLDSTLLGDLRCIVSVDHPLSLALFSFAIFSLPSLMHSHPAVSIFLRREFCG
jgi:hypothetical protein